MMKRLFRLVIILSMCAVFLLLSLSGETNFSDRKSAEFVEYNVVDVNNNIPRGTTTIFSETFEGAFPSGGSWTVGDSTSDAGADYWDDTSYRYYGGSWSGWCAMIGDNSVYGGTNYANHKYDNYMDACMYKSVSLGSYSSATLSYYYWLDSENSYDKLYVTYYSGGSWSFVDMRTGNSGGWQYSSVSIPTSATYVGLHFYSDLSACSYEGAYIDNVVLTGTTAANNPPNVPSFTSAPTSCIAGTSYTYTVYTTDPNGDNIMYYIDWGDGTAQSTSGWLASGTSWSTAKTWSTAGTYYIYVGAYDSNSAWSGWSSAVTVTVTATNSPPNTPGTPSGPTSGVTGTSYTYSTSATDPDGNNVKYTFDWGDATTTTTGFVASGTSASASHSWSSAGTYYVDAYATDINGATSGWSSSLTVTITAANSPPPAPTLSSPANGATGISTTPTLICNSVIDPNGDAVRYYFEVDDNADWSSPATLGFAGGTGVTNYVVGTSGDAKTLLASTKYYWCVCAYDGTVFGGWSSVWSFTTATPNSPPNTPSTPSGPTSGSTGTSYTYSTSATDPDGNNVKYTFDWGDATTTTTAFVTSGTSASEAHSWSSAGTYSVKAYATDSNGASSGWSSSLTVTITINLGEAVDNTALSWTTGGDANWFGQTTTYYYGNDAAQSGDIADSQSTYIQTTVTGPGTLRFYWKVSSETNYDFLRFYIDGTEQAGSISGEVSWTQITFSISSGSHTLQWNYTKDSSVSLGSDCGWLDKVEFSGAVNSPPTASFTYSPTAPTTADTIQFTDTSTDSDGTITAWSWNFGDGSTSTVKNPTHKYTSAGTYTVALTVTDNGSATNSASKSITVSWGGGGALGLVYVLVTDSVYSSIQSNITTYKSDLENEGYTVGIYNGSWTTVSSVRTILQNGLSSGLVGAVLVGNIPIAWYKLKDPDSWGLADPWETFPIELYYMDLDGTWSPGSGTQTDPFTDHTGNTAPEIWVGRLYASTAGGTEVTLLKNYFYKNHLYRTGGLSLPQKALVYVDNDWYSLADQWSNDVGLLYTDRTLVKDYETTNASDYKNRLTQSYEWVSLFAHSDETTHYLYTSAGWTYAYNTEITTVNPHASFYNLYCCHAANYAYGSDNGYIGGHYIFGNTYGLEAVGSTKTGSMLNFDDFYTPLKNGKTIGNAFKDWYTLNGETGVTDSRAWFYGMTVLGDPTLKPSSAATDTTPPTGSVSINSGATYTTSTSVTLTLSASDAETGVSQMCFSNNGTTYTAWEAYATSKSWTLTTSDGTKTVYVKFKNGAGLESSPYSDTITLDTTAPTGSISINSGDTYTTSTSVTLTLSASDTTSGVSQMCFSNNGTTYTAWEAYAISKSWTLTTSDGTKTVYVKFKNGAGLESSPYSNTIILDTTAPNIISTTPSNNAVNVSLTQNITIQFIEEMNTSSVQYTCLPDPGGWVSSWNATKNTLTLAHTEFGPGVTYTFNITAAKDLAGNGLASGLVSNPWTFTTEKVVKFDFQQGSNSFTLPFVSSTIKDAESLANAIGKNCTGIAYWDNTLGRFITHPAGTDISNFNIELGVGYIVFVSGKTVFTFTGESKINSVTMSLGAGWNSIGRFNETTTTAETIGGTISNCTHIAKWNATTQSFDVYVVGSGVNNFNIEQGDICLVYVTKGSQWVNQ